MNALETNLALWAICSILLFEILIIICLCRCCFNRIRPKKFYVKREEYEYLQDVPTGTQSKFQSTILRPPHADELALVGTLRRHKPVVSYSDGFQNTAFSSDGNDPERIRQIQSQNWIELQPNIIKTTQLLPADYEIHTHPMKDYNYTHARPAAILDIRSFRDDLSDEKNNFENFRFQPLRRPELLLPQTQRIDTSTEFNSLPYSHTIPKSILKTGTNTSPSRSRTSSKYDDSPYISVKINTDRPMNSKDKRIFSSPPILSSAPHRMRFASVSELNDIEWEVPREFHTIIRDQQTSHSNHPHNSSSIIDSKSRRSWQYESNISQPYSLLQHDTTQQQAFEY